MSTRAIPVSFISANLSSLPRMLAFDGATCVLMGALLVLATGPLATMAALPADLLFAAGLALFPCAMIMFAGAARARWTATIARTTISLNLAWIVGSMLVAAMLPANALGHAFVLIQAIAVVVITVLEVRALRRWSAGGAP